MNNYDAFTVTCILIVVSLATAFFLDVRQPEPEQDTIFQDECAMMGGGAFNGADGNMYCISTDVVIG
jgi:hypothetical protein